MVNVSYSPIHDFMAYASASKGYREGAGITLANCPFHGLAQEYTDLVCGMNLEIMEGFTEVLEGAGLVACLEPCAGQCCVRLNTVSQAS